MAVARSPTAVRPFICQSCRQSLLPTTRRAFTTTTAPRADTPTNTNDDPTIAPLNTLSKTLNLNQTRSRQPQRRASNPDTNLNPFTSIIDAPSSLYAEEASRNLDNPRNELPHRLHVYAHKHNTHLTLIQPPRSAAETASSRLAGTKVTAAEQKRMVDTLISLSTGNIGFRKAARGTYDAAFQLTAFVMKQMEEKGMWPGVKNLEVVLRGFGAGREAVTKALLGSEGRIARHRISAVVDATRLKQGGPRSPKPRRLG